MLNYQRVNMDIMDLTNMKELIIGIMLLQQSEQSVHISR